MKLPIIRIKPPKYKVGKYVLNEYELRCLLVEVCEGRAMGDIHVSDEFGNSTKILPDGRLEHNCLNGLDINSLFTLRLIRNRREREKDISLLQ